MLSLCNALENGQEAAFISKLYVAHHLFMITINKPNWPIRYVLIIYVFDKYNFNSNWRNNHQ